MSGTAVAETDFVRACGLGDLPDVGAVLVEIDGRRIAIARDSDGEVHAIDDTCTHGQVSLAEGEVEDTYIECWLHGSQFELRTGKPISLPATVPVAVHTVKLDGDDVLVSVTSTN